MISSVFYIALQIAGIINFLCAVFIVFYERKNPIVTWAWLMVLALVPAFGFILYFIIGFEGRKHKTFWNKLKVDEDFYKKFYSNNDEIISEQIKRFDKESILNEKCYNDIVLLNLISANSPLTKGNCIRTYHEGISKFRDLFKDIKNAESFVHMQYYIIRDDILGRKLIQLLADKAAQGVEICLLYDGIGNVSNSKNFDTALKASGGRICRFLPPRFIRINYRNHRKICVIDGKIGYVGGFNVGLEYMGESRKFGFWRDSHIRIEGEGVRELELRFICDWNFSAKDSFFESIAKKYLRKGQGIYPKKLIVNEKRYFPISALDGDTDIQIVSSGPDSRWDSIQQGYFRLMASAEKSIYIETPYFVPDESIFNILKIAALSGVDVKIVFPAHPDHPFVYWASLSYLGELLEAGVKCYKYEKGFIHSKVLIIDSKIVSVGTANMDIRSFKLNFEINAFVYSEQLSEEFSAQFYEDLDDSDEITLELYNARSRLTRIKEAVSRLISPLL